ncbi:DsbA family protein [Solirubrobacter sp. CPCC 204708]|uniref:DsbA family protein n=1 Tax=Solirubrobacter deserti TaxID=2282478 RepID=A0ABT4REA5_9ACTN|nr:DsbA family protein [Solirubrobacter deserti]MBE2316113.1 DsbA family protein [Solirubrobacter deserti]MDA0136863.1 DsbA family protein [Solirubrobacter deserti]
MAIDIELFTDPACPFAFSAEPMRQRLRWHYGDGLRWRTTMIVLTLEPGEAEKLQSGAPGLQRKYGMPIDPAPYPEPSSSEPACRAVVAARLNAPELEERLLRRLRVRRMDGGLLDDPELIAGAAAEAGLDPDELRRWCDTAGVEDALRDDIARARHPSAAARALDHKLGGPAQERRYTAPSYELASGGQTFSLPGFNPVEAYEAAIANLDPQLPRRPKPENVTELLKWADEPLATAEVELIMQRPSRAQLARVAQPIPTGADCYWRL